MDLISNLLKRFWYSKDPKADKDENGDDLSQRAYLIRDQKEHNIKIYINNGRNPVIAFANGTAYPRQKSS
jgi:hypothetical protein